MKVISLENLKTFYDNSKKSLGNMTNITYAELKTLRDNSQLVEGKLYRIIDFVTTVDQEDARSAGHAFDIIVLATSPNTLSENALAAKHEGDTYFANSNLDAWELKYDLDNDKSKYAWADATNGKGVIFYMKDEFNNECPYDFKNVLFKRYKLKDESGLHLADYQLQQSPFGNILKQAFKNWKNGLFAAIDKDNISLYYTRGVYEEGYLVSGADIYNYDSHSYKSYDEGKLVFDGSSGGNYVGVCKKYNSFDIIAEVANTKGEWFYTFSKKAKATAAAMDASLSKLTNIKCYHNSIKEYINNGIYYLNNNIFITISRTGYMHSNNFNINCYNNTFGNYCYSNTFGSGCYFNTFGSGCYFNTFRDYCLFNTFGSDCYSNTFGSYFQNNTFGNYCYSNTFGSGCYSNTFGSDCNNNIFGDYFENNQFKTYSYGVSFELYTTGSSMKMQYLKIYKVNSNTTIPADLITLNANYSQVLGLNSAGELVCKPALDDLLPTLLEESLAYGIEFDTTISSPICTRIGNLALHKTLPIQSRMRGCLLDDNGKVVEYLNPTSWLQHDRTGARGQVMVEIPSHYERFVTEGTKRRVMLSEHHILGYNFIPTMYVSAYEASIEHSTKKLCSVVNDSADYRGGSNNAEWDGTYRSLLGRPAATITRGNFRNYARNRNAAATAEWNCYTYLVHKTITWLFVVEYATLNSQADYNAELTTEGFRQGGLGAGVSTFPDWSTYNGQNPFVPCGFTDSIGNGTGVMDYTAFDENGEVYSVQSVPRYRGIENPFGHIWKWTDGCNFEINPTEENGGNGLTKAYICNDPALFQDTNYDGYQFIGNMPREGFWIKEIVFGEGGEILPTKLGGGSTVYFCDYYWYNVTDASSIMLCSLALGGCAPDNVCNGLFLSISRNNTSYISGIVGSRLCFIPEAA